VHGRGAALDAEAAGARWEPAPDPAPELPVEVAAKIGDVCYDVATRDVRHHWTDYACAMRAALAPLWPRQQPAGPGPEPAAGLPAEALAEIETGIEDYLEVGGELRMALVNSIADRLAPLWLHRQPAGPGRERRLAVPLWMAARGTGAAGRKLFDLLTADDRSVRLRLDPGDAMVIVELVNHYNAPPSPADWPAPRRGREGLPPAGKVHLWDGEDWVAVRTRAVEGDGRWLPQPPPPPEAP
jgi:hypothetical protein